MNLYKLDSLTSYYLKLYIIFIANRTIYIIKNHKYLIFYEFSYKHT